MVTGLVVLQLSTKEDELKRRVDTTEYRLRMSEADHHMDIETALVKLEEEQQRASSLSHVNTMLREQLDQATAANQQLTSDIHKLTHDWQRAREELESKEAEWRDEEQVLVKLLRHSFSAFHLEEQLSIVLFCCSRSTSTSATNTRVCSTCGAPSSLSGASSAR